MFNNHLILYCRHLQYITLLHYLAQIFEFYLKTAAMVYLFQPMNSG